MLKNLLLHSEQGGEVEGIPSLITGVYWVSTNSAPLLPYRLLGAVVLPDLIDAEGAVYYPHMDFRFDRRGIREVASEIPYATMDTWETTFSRDSSAPGKHILGKVRMVAYPNEVPSPLTPLQKAEDPEVLGGSPDHSALPSTPLPLSVDPAEPSCPNG